MKTPIYCPKCKGPLNSTQIRLKNGSEVWRKTCTTNLDHYLNFMTAQGDDDSISTFSILLSRQSKVQVIWNFPSKRIMVCQLDFKGVSPVQNDIPWFEPDIENFDKLFNKIKTYIVFS